MTEVCVHLENKLIPLLKRPFEASDIGCTQSQLALSLKDMETGSELASHQFLHDGSSTVRASVINNKDIKVFLQTEHGPDNLLDILLFIISRNNYNTITHKLLLV